jgi:hypothetical protein
MFYPNVRTKLKGFPINYYLTGCPELQALNEAYDAIGNTSSVYGFESCALAPLTDDGYKWYTSFTFDVEGRSVVILFPQRNTERRSRITLDRSIAAYGDKRLPTSVAKGVLEMLSEQLNSPRKFNE